MATGYTADIVDGKITTFKEFATKCMRAFGATMHMRDEPLNTPYRPAETSQYYLHELAELEKEKARIESMSEEDLVSTRKNELLERKRELEEIIRERKESRKRLEKILAEAKKYQPPTEDHEGIRKFMIAQLETTIEWDGSSEYYEKELKEVKEKINDLNPEEIRKELLDDIIYDLKYYTEKHNEDLKSVERSNKWVEDFLKSIE